MLQHIPYIIFIVKGVLRNGLVILNLLTIRNYMNPKHRDFSQGFTLGFIFIIIRLSPEKMRNRKRDIEIPLFSKKLVFFSFLLRTMGRSHQDRRHGSVGVRRLSGNTFFLIIRQASTSFFFLK